MYTAAYSTRNDHLSSKLTYSTPYNRYLPTVDVFDCILHMHSMLYSTCVGNVELGYIGTCGLWWYHRHAYACIIGVVGQSG